MQNKLFDIMFCRLNIFDYICARIVIQRKWKLQHLADMLQTDYALESDLHSQRFPLTKNNLGYRLRKENIICNTFVVRPSCDIINFDNRRLLIAYRMADLISKELDAARGIRPEDSADFKDTCFGYKDIKIEK